MSEQSIIYLDEQRTALIPQVIELYRAELPALTQNFANGEAEECLDNKLEERMRCIATSRGARIFDMSGYSASRTLAMRTCEDKLEGILESVRYTEGAYEINFISWILAAQKGKGTGTALLKHHIDAGRSDKALDVIGLTVAKRNTDAVRLYEKMGFSFLRDHEIRPTMAIYAIYLK